MHGFKLVMSIFSSGAPYHREKVSAIRFSELSGLWAFIEGLHVTIIGIWEKFSSPCDM